MPNTQLPKLTAEMMDKVIKDSREEQVRRQLRILRQVLPHASR